MEVHNGTMHLFRGKCFFPVYRLEEADSLLKEGGVWGSDGALRARSYKTHPKPKLQGEAPRLFKGFILVFVFYI